MAGDKTEKPTPKRIRKARKEGRIARTADFSAWVGLLAASTLIPMVVGHLISIVTRFFDVLPAMIANPEPGRALSLLSSNMRSGALAAAPLAFGIMGTGIALTAAQGGIHPSLSLLKPKFSRLNPLAGMKKMFGPHGLWEGAKALLKTAVLAYVMWRALRQTVTHLVTAGAIPLSGSIGLTVHALVTLVRAAAVTGLVVAAMDYGVVKFRLVRSLRMTKHDVKEENRQSEGDPHVKGQIRARQMAISRNRMMADVAKADVVMVNPTHVAVALRYDPARGAPRVLARGAGVLAAKIREEASKHRVPMVENIPLARALYRSCELGQEIPPELYTAVARVLAFVLSLKSRGSGAGLHRPGHPVDESLNSLPRRPKGRRPGKAPPASGTSHATTTRR